MKSITTKVTKPSSIEPVTISQVKSQVRLSDDDREENEYISMLITCAREFAEDFTGRAIITKTVVAGYENWPDFDEDKLLFYVPYPNLQSVTSLKYRDPSNGELTDLDSSLYKIDTNSLPGMVAFKKSTGLPVISQDFNAPIELTFQAGYGDNRSDVPNQLKLAILYMVALWYRMRLPVITGLNINKVPDTAERLLRHYKVPRI